MGTTIEDIVTLTLKLNILLNNFNLHANFWTRRNRARALIFHTSLWKDLLHHSIVFDLVTLTLTVDLLFTFNFWMVVIYNMDAAGELFCLKVENP